MFLKAEDGRRETGDGRRGTGDVGRPYVADGPCRMHSPEATDGQLKLEGIGDFLLEGFGGRPGVAGVADGAADDDVVGAGGEGFGG